MATEMEEFCEAHQQVLQKWRNHGIPEFYLDTIARRKLIEDQNTILELSGSVQELQDEVNVWAILRIFRMLNQFAVEIHTLPVDSVIPTSSNS